jgi:ubiquitin C-terminal hydrolase
MSTVYSLFAVSNHSGGLGGGHYTAHCRHPTTKRWALFNDSHVSEADERSIGGPNAYVLFFEKVGSREGRENQLSRY